MIGSLRDPIKAEYCLTNGEALVVELTGARATRLVASRGGCGRPVALGVGRHVVKEALTEADDFVLDVAELAIELDDFRIGRTHHEVELRAATFHEEALGFVHEISPERLLAIASGDSEVVRPSAVAVEADHYRSHHFTSGLTDEEQLRLFCELASDVCPRVVPRTRETALLPKRDNSCFICGLKRADLHGKNDAQRSR